MRKILKEEKSCGGYDRGRRQVDKLARNALHPKRTFYEPYYINDHLIAALRCVL
jgi:hypothetical protein